MRVSIVFRISVSFVLLPALFGCANSSEKAVKEVLEFAEDAPYTISTPVNKYSGFSIAVVDSGLGAYNRIFKHFKSDDTTRSKLYRDIPVSLFSRLPITHLAGISSKKKTGDTVEVSAIFQRPEYDLFINQFQDFFGIDSLAPSDSEKVKFHKSIVRIRQELQTIDTVFFSVVKGAQIVDFETASERREIAEQKALEDVAIKEFGKIVQRVKWSDIDISDYIYLRGYATGGGGSVKGMLTPSSEWYKNSKVKTYTEMRVQCEASRNNQVVIQDAYIDLSDLSGLEPTDFLCLWSGKEARQWDKMSPDRFKIRLVGIVGRDSVFSEWFDITNFK